MDCDFEFNCLGHFFFGSNFVSIHFAREAERPNQDICRRILAESEVVNRSVGGGWWQESHHDA